MLLKLYRHFVCGLRIYVCSWDLEIMFLFFIFIFFFDFFQIFMPPPIRRIADGHLVLPLSVPYICPSVRPSVCPSVRPTSYPGHNSQTVWNIFMKLHRCIHHIETMCHEQGRQLLHFWFLNYFRLTYLVPYS